MIVPTQERSLSGRAWWAIVVASFSAVIVLAAVLGVIVTHRSHPETASTPTTTADAAMQQWWSVAQEHFDALQSAVDDTRKGLANQDEAVLRKSCQDMHDAGAVDLRAHLPTPNPDLTAEIDAAINDAHEASHMCLAAISGSLNNYAGEFDADLEQADKHLQAALAMINKGRFTA
ncbi:hypothetical protein ACGFK1_08435 [Mycobacterium sp. NPDC048908]|uniref:hypothetical protein n=1 Tax=Mycobacterium sp. NPDC048908 TaxID=3364292 RepID=UPI00372404DD